jgi:hypothetical protein
VAAAARLARRSAERQIGRNPDAELAEDAGDPTVAHAEGISDREWDKAALVEIRDVVSEQRTPKLERCLPACSCFVGLRELREFSAPLRT